jgi:lysophospholipase L1-like esterase
VADDGLGWRMAAGYDGEFAKETHVAINSIGLRDYEYADKQPNEMRVLSLGDSYAFGHGVEHEEIYAKRLEAKLRERLGKADTHVISAGVDGYNTRQIASEFARLAPLLKPDFVIITFVAGNDVAENAIFERQLQTRLQSPVGFIAQNSHLARLILRASFGPHFFIANRSQKNIDYTIECYERLEKKLADAEIPYLVLIIPARHQVDPSVHIGALLVSAVDANDYLMRQNRRIAAHFEETGVSYIDLFPVLTNKEQPTYFDDDPHTNAYGHDLIADAIVEQIEPMLREAVSKLN